MRKTQTSRTLMLILTLTLATGLAAQQANITVDLDSTMQTIEGFGVHGGLARAYTSGPYYNEAYLDVLVNQLGTSMTAVHSDGELECTNDNNDPYTLDMSALTPSAKCNSSHGSSEASFDKYTTFLKALKDKADEENEPLLVTMRLLSPPPWTKVCDCISGEASASPTPDETTVRLIDDPDIHEEVAEYFIAMYRTVEAECGVAPYAFSLQNEPVFQQWYSSCVYSVDSYREVFTVVSERLNREGLGHVRWFGPEDVVANLMRYRQWVNLILQDPVAGANMDVVAIHGLSTDGVTPYAPSVTTWNHIRTEAARYGKPVWDSEAYIADEADWPQAMNDVRSLVQGIRYGGVSGWLYAGNIDKAYVTSDGTGLRPGGHAARHIYRFVRPGAVHVAGSSDDDSVGVVAFDHPGNQCITVVVINDAHSPRSISLCGDGLPATMEGHLSSTGALSQELGTVSPTGVEMPGQSMLTLVSGAYRHTGEYVSVQAQWSPRRRMKAAPAQTRSHTVCYTLRGQRISGVGSGPMTPALYVYRASDGTVRRILRTRPH